MNRHRGKSFQSFLTMLPLVHPLGPVACPKLKPCLWVYIYEISRLNCCFLCPRTLRSKDELCPLPVNAGMPSQVFRIQHGRRRRTDNVQRVPPHAATSSICRNQRTCLLLAQRPPVVCSPEDCGGAAGSCAMMKWMPERFVERCLMPRHRTYPLASPHALSIAPLFICVYR